MQIFKLSWVGVLGVLTTLSACIGTDLEKHDNAKLSFLPVYYHKIHGLIVYSSKQVGILLEDGTVSPLHQEKTPDHYITKLWCVTATDAYIERKQSETEPFTKGYLSFQSTDLPVLRIPLDGGAAEPISQEAYHEILDGKSCLADPRAAKFEELQAWPDRPAFEKKLGYLCLSAGCSVYMRREGLVIGTSQIIVQRGYPVTDASAGIWVRDTADESPTWDKVTLPKGARLLPRIRFTDDGRVAIPIVTQSGGRVQAKVFFTHIDNR